MSVRPDIVEYVKKGLKNGNTIDSLRNTLIQSGHSSSNVEDSINSIQNISPVKTQAEIDTHVSGKSRKPIIIVTVIIIVIAVIGLLFFSGGLTSLIAKDCGFYDPSDSSTQSVQDCYINAVETCETVSMSQTGGAVIEIIGIRDNICLSTLKINGQLNDVICYGKSGDNFGQNVNCPSELKQEFFGESTEYYEENDPNETGEYCGTKKYQDDNADNLVRSCFLSTKSNCEDAYMLDYGNEGITVYKHVIKNLGETCTYIVYYKGSITRKTCWPVDDPSKESSC